MNNPNRSRVIRILVVLVVMAGVAIVMREAFSCTPPHDEAQMLARFEADPLTGIAPKDGRLVQQWSHSYWCDSGHGVSPTGTSFAEVKRLYQTPAVYEVVQLRQLFDDSAVAGGWLLGDLSFGAAGDGARLRYTKRIGCAVTAIVTSSSYAVVTGPANNLKLSPGVELLIAASYECHTPLAGQAEGQRWPAR